MRAVVVTTPGPAEALAIHEVADPVLQPGEVLVEVVAAGLNRADILQRQGFYPPPPGASEYLGMEASGRIVAVGEGVEGWSVGDEVCALLTGGGYATLVAVPAGQLLPLPEGVGLVQAAALPEVTCTVWSMVFELARLGPGERFLVHGGTSGIGTMAIQLANALGARVFTTAGSTRKTQAALELGASVAVNYKEQDFVAAIREATAQDANGPGVEVILDNIGAAYLGRNIDALATDGRLAILGMQGGVKGELNIGKLLTKRAAVMAAALRPRTLADKARIVAAVREFVWPLIASGQVQPVIDTVYPLENVVAAHAGMESSEHIGKILLQISG